MGDCENLEEYCLMYAHLWNCIDELDDIGVTGKAYEQLVKWQWEEVENIYETSKRMLMNRENCRVERKQLEEYMKIGGRNE